MTAEHENACSTLESEVSSVLPATGGLPAAQPSNDASTTTPATPADTSPQTGPPGSGVTPMMHGLESGYSLGIYDNALRELAQARMESASMLVLDVLLARDRVSRLCDRGVELRPVEVEKLAKLDAELRRSADAIDSVHGKKLRSWKVTMDPASERWWWSLDELAASERVKLRPGTAVLVTVCLGISFVITGDTVGQLLKLAAISVGVVAIVIQASLTFFTGNVLTESGRKRMMSLLSGFGLKGSFRDIKVVVLAFGVVALSILGWWLLPEAVVRHYVAEGNDFEEKKEWTRAIESYKRALTLRPSDLDLHSKQAVAYDKSFQFDHAKDEYKLIVEADGTKLFALNNLARLFIIDKAEVPALRLLDQVTARITKMGPNDKYFVFKNRGWAKFGLQLYDDAEDDLRAALKARPDDGAAAHYLLGRVLEEQRRPEDARKHYEKMLEIVAHGKDDESDLEPDWIIRAQRKLQGATK